MTRKVANTQVFVRRGDEFLLANSANVIKIQRTSGGSSLDSCLIELTETEPLEGLELSGSRPEIDVTINGIAVFWGVLESPHLSISEQTQRRQLTFRSEPRHFGGPVDHVPEYDPVSKTYVNNDRPLVFNPEIDHRILGNRDPNRHPDGYSVPIDPESLLTDQAKRVHDYKTGAMWSVWDIVGFVCSHYNTAGYIENPTTAALEDYANRWTAPPVRNFRVPYGTRVPRILDELLAPLGFGWYIHYQNVGSRYIEIFKRGESSNARQVYLPAFGARYVDESQTNAHSLGIDYSLGATTNQVTVLGDYEYHEATFPLVKGWSSEHDTLTINKLSKDHADYAANQAYQRVYRDWVLNEAGDYVGIRADITKPYDLSPLFGHTAIPRRRKFLPCLTLGPDGEPRGDVRGCVIEFSTNGGLTWKPISMIPGAAPQIMQHQCGIRFEGQTPPSILMARGSGIENQIKMRITATIRSDKRMRAKAVKRTSSILTDEVAEEIVDAADRFTKRKVHSSSSFYERVQNNELKAHETDDTESLQSYADRIRNAWDMADVSGAVVLDGLDGFQYDIGDIVTGVFGRDISFSAAGPNAPRYPQIVGIVYNVQEQSRSISLETFRETGSI